MSDGLTVPFALAGGYVVRNSPVTQQDRWEMDLGYSPFTLAVEIAALLVAANLADVAAEPQIATYLRGKRSPT
jgi:glucoamylase